MRLLTKAIATLLGSLICAHAHVAVNAQPVPDQQVQHSAEDGQEMSAGGGVNTGTPHAAILDSEHRPITAGGFVKGAPVIFEDATKASGLANFHHRMGTPEKSFILETLGSGGRSPGL